MTFTDKNRPDEAKGQKFSLEKLLYAQKKSKIALHKIAEAIEIGMFEEDARELAKKILRESGMEREWHPTLVRFGNNTTKLFREPSTPQTQLQKNDIFFIDIGPVFEEHEGDSGATFTVGSNSEMIACAQAAKNLFDTVKNHWLNIRPTGQALYTYAEQTAKEKGWKLNLGSPGHRIGDFPHAIHKADRLAEIDFTPSEALWILEIQICHPTLPFGAFYEDLLISAQ